MNGARHDTGRDTGPVGVAGQLAALAPLALRSAREARWASATIVVSVMLVMLVLNFFLATTRGFEDVGASMGADDIVVVLGAQSQSEATSTLDAEQLALLENGPGLLPLSAQARLSPELTVGVSRRAPVRAGRINAQLRGLRAQGLSLRPGFRIAEGRLFRAGQYELTIGRALATRMAVNVGARLTLGGQLWTVVGKHAMASPVHESELLADLDAVQSAYRREGQVQSVRVRLGGDGALARFRQFIASDARLQVNLLTERELYRKQMEGTESIIRHVGWPLVAVLSLGALAGMLNTLLIMLEGRREVLRTLRILGFSPAAVRLCVVLEALLLAVAGALLAGLMIYWLADGRAASFTGGAYTTLDYRLRFDATVLLHSLGLAGLLGIAGGALSGLAIAPHARTTKGEHS
jgi:putative ABC transport system permease protein